ncbi:MAG TPA: alcohol dehydrogenase catalytic domain-containing protein, partial [Rhodanobacteraceae bacterium]|nr:alcohol dehydrogenase catalytic domain-containing protein [Rhodanobacteraceae bacterium]
MSTKAYGAHAADKKLEPIDIERRAPGARDVQIEIAYCGVCHSDLHTVRSEWAGTLYPCVPGHEIVGKVTAVGGDVKKFKVGDTVGVG